MSNDANYDWLNVNLAIENSATDVHSIALNSIDLNVGTSFCAAEGTTRANTFLFDTIPKCTGDVFEILNTSVVTFTMCVIVFTIIMLSQFITVIWTERKLITSHLLKKFGKTLTDSAFDNQLAMIASKREANNPAFLQLLCTEISKFGVFEKVHEELKLLG